MARRGKTPAVEDEGLLANSGDLSLLLKERGGGKRRFKMVNLTNMKTLVAFEFVNHHPFLEAHGQIL